MKPLALFVAVTIFYFPSAAVAQEVDDPVIVTQTPEGPVIDPDDNPNLRLSEPSQEQTDILSALSQVENLGIEIEILVDLISKATSLQAFDAGTLDRIEAEILSWTKPLSASNLEENLAGYSALANLRPENSVYQRKRDDYQGKVVELKRSILKNYRTETDDFSGITWYRHKKEPRYVDTRPFVVLYIGQKEGQPPFLRFVLNYTGDSWLFVENAQVNIDGDIVDIPASEWQRDNDSEIWEWIDVPATSSYTEIARRIASSEKTVVRFNGQQYYDNYVVTAEDKEVLRDGLLAHEVMLEQMGKDNP